MMSLEVAKSLVLEEANRVPPTVGEWKITDVVERPWGWAIGYDLRGLIEDGDFIHAVARNVPMIVDARDGVMLTTRAQLGIDEQLDAYERGEWDWWELTWARFDAHRRYNRDREAAQTLVDLTLGSVPDERDPRAEYITTGGVALIEQTCLALVESDPRSPLAAIAATCIGHLARIHGSIRDPRRVITTLTALRFDPALGGRCQDALDDIDVFTTLTPAAEQAWRDWVPGDGGGGPPTADDEDRP